MSIFLKLSFKFSKIVLSLSVKIRYLCKRNLIIE